MKLNISFLLLFALIFSNCNNSNDNPNRSSIQVSSNNLTKIWKAVDFVYDNTIDGNKLTNKQDLELQEKKYIYLNKGFYIYLFPDGQSAKIIDTLYESSNWTLNNDKQMLILNNSKNKEESEIKEYFEEDGNHYMVIKLNNNQELKLIEQYKMVDNYKLDPFYPSNNKWRIKPSKAETTLALKRRLLNYILHYKFLFKTASERNSKHISLHCSKGIIQIYDGGIGFVKWYKIAPEWKNTYYNEKDATDGYNIYKDYLDNKVMSKGGNESLIKKNYAILTKIHQKIIDDIKLNY